MSFHHLRSLMLAGFACMLFAVPVAAMANPAAEDPQTIAVRDVRTGDGPCGFLVERTIEGTVEVLPSIDAAGHLVLAVEPVSLRGFLTNPANGKSVELRWVKQNGLATFGVDGTATTASLALTGHFFRGYDSAPSDLEMALPADGVESLTFEAGERSKDPWTHVCGLLA